MTTLDDIIDRHRMVKPHELNKALEKVSSAFDERYECADGFLVTYNATSGTARLHFKGQERPLETPVPTEQRDYLVKSNYWRPL